MTRLAALHTLAQSVVGRLLIGWAIVIMLLGLTSAAGAYSVGQVSDHAAHIAQADDGLLTNVTTRVKLVEDEETGLRGYLLTRDPRFLQPYGQARLILPRLRAQGTTLVSKVPSMRSLLIASTGAALTWERWAQDILRHPPADSRTPATIAQQLKGKRLFDRFRAASTRLTQAINADRLHDLDQTRRIRTLLDWILAVIFVAAILTTLLVGWLTMRAITRPLKLLSSAARAIGGGDLDQAVEVTGAREFADLAMSMDHMRRQLAEEAATRSQAETRLREHTERLSMIVETQSAIAAAGPNSDAVLTIATERAQELTGAVGAVVELLEGDEMVYRAATGTVAPSIGLRLKSNASLSGLSVRTGEILRCDDSETDPRVDQAAARRVGARSMVVVPLLTTTGIRGVLKVLSPEPGTFADHDVDTLRLIAGEIAAAMRTAAEFDEKQDLLVERISVAEELARANAHLKHQALHDGLTGLANRILLYDRLEHTIRAARRNAACMGLMLMDLDHFKEVNDTLGHHAGDCLLQEVAARLRSILRESDTIARLGGDEFAVILGAVDGQRATLVARKIHTVLQKPLVLEGQRMPIHASIGIALFPDHGEDGGTLLRHADAAMYAAKRTEREYCVYSQEHDLTGLAPLAHLGRRGSRS